jgi:hypothetical protein
MKKFTFIVGILFISNFSFSQNLFSGGFYAGVVGSQVDGDLMAGFNQGGFTAGAIAQLPVADNIFLSLGIDYTMKGSQERNYPGSPRAYSLRINYIDLPLMINFYDRQRIGVGGGICYSRLIGNKKENIFNNGLNFNYKPVNVGNDDILWVGSGTYYFNDKLQLNIRYCYSVVPFGSNENSRYKNLGTFNNLIQVRLGVIFGQEFDDRKKMKINIQ